MIRIILMALLVGLAASLAACGGSRGSRAGSEGLEHFRTPHPTFTPTAQAAGQPAAVAAGQGEAATQNVQAAVTPAIALEAPSAIVNAPLVNLRSGPGTDTEIVATVARGAEFDIVGRSDDGEWWQVCCEGDQVVWVASEFADSVGPLDAVPLSDGTGPAPAPTIDGLGGSANQNQSSFELVAKEQFPETNLVRVYLYVYDGVNALAGYKLRIEKDGREIPGSAQSFGGQPAFTWPFQDARQRYQNLKIEIPDEPPAGTWRVQLIDPEGNIAGPPAEFTLAENDPQRELYVRYERGN